MKIGPFKFKTRKELKAEISRKTFELQLLSRETDALHKRYLEEFFKRYPPKKGVRFITHFPGNIFKIAIPPEMPVWTEEYSESKECTVNVNEEAVVMREYRYADSKRFHLGYCKGMDEWIIGI